MRPLVVANWKMNPRTLREAIVLARAVERGIAGSRGVEVVIAPPFPFLNAVAGVLRRSRLGAQNLFPAPGGAYTGEVSGVMLRDLGVRAVILGHSERRRILGERDEFINAKVKAALAAGLLPVIAVGEGGRESQEVVVPVIAEQLKRALAGIPKRALAGIAVAYEPVWAIGTGHADTPDNATRRALYIRKLLTQRLGARVSDSIRILYGGSVTAKNATTFISRDIRGMEGLLVGGASLDAEEFVRIARSVTESRRRSLRQGRTRR